MNGKRFVKIEMPFDEIDSIQEVDSFTGELIGDMDEIKIFPAAHNVTTKEKIDGAIATIMALDRAIRCGNDTGESVYNTRGLLVF